MEKAAVCWLLEGDARSASSAVSRFLRDRAARQDRTAAFAQARWELLLGRSASSISRFSIAAGNRTDPLAPQAAFMLALRLAFLDASSAARWLAPAPGPDGALQLYRTFAAAALDPASIDKVRDSGSSSSSAPSRSPRRDWPARRQEPGRP